MVPADDLRTDFQRLVDFRVRHHRDGHDVERGFVAELVAVLDHFHRLGNLVDVAGNADHVQHAVLGGKDLVFPIALAAGVGHGGEFQAGGRERMIAHHAAQVLLLAVPPRAVFRPCGNCAGEFL